MMAEAEKRRLVYGEDYLITSRKNQEWASGVPNEYIMELQGLADLFVFPSEQEMCPNALLEASACGQLVVVPEHLQVAREMSAESVLTFRFPVHGQHIEYTHGKKTFYAAVAREIWAEHRLNRVVQQKVRARRDLNIVRIFDQYFEPLIHSDIPHWWEDLEKKPLNIPTEEEILAEEEREEQELMRALAQGGE